MTDAARVTPVKRQNHLEYYRQHGIAPVSYDLSSMEAHLQRREALYNKLGLLPIAFKGSTVLEVAAGTGHNSLYLAQLHPTRLLLLEPNAMAVDHIRAAYAGFDLPHATPEIVTQTLEEFAPTESFDVVLCENWLGSSAHELGLLDKLSRMVAPGGALVVTAVSPIGFVPNLLRRFLVPALVTEESEFGAKSEALEAAFGPHLKTLGAMTRSVRDWVQDNMLNPAYFGLCLSIPAVVDRQAESFDVIGASPSFAEDWRWFKSMAGEGRGINEHFLSEYWRKANNYLDHRQPGNLGDPAATRQLEQLAYQILTAVETHEDAYLAKRPDVAESALWLRELLTRFIAALPDELPAAVALREFAAVAFALPANASDAIAVVAKMDHFGALFGRETSYLSLLRRPVGLTGTAA